MKKIIITEKQLEDMVKHIKENHDDGSYMAKQQYGINPEIEPENFKQSLDIKEIVDDMLVPE